MEYQLCKLSTSQDEKAKLSVTMDRMEALLRERVRDYYPRPPNSGEAMLQREGALHKAAHSSVQRYRVNIGDGREQELILKVHKDYPDEQKSASCAARREYEVLQLLWKGFEGSRGLCVPKPLDLFEREGAVVMEAVEGEELFSLIKKGVGRLKRSVSLDSLLHYVELCAQWLARFQEFTLKVGEDGALPDVQAEFSSDMASYLKSSVELGLDRSLADRARRCVEELTSNIRWDLLEVVGVRADFAPWNVFVSSGSLSTVDFAGFRYGGGYFDPSFFLASLMAMAKNPMRSKRKIAALEARFTRACFSKMKLDGRIFRAYRVMNLLHLLSEERWRLKRGGLHRRMAFGKVLRHYEACIERSL